MTKKEKGKSREWKKKERKIKENKGGKKERKERRKKRKKEQTNEQERKEGRKEENVCTIDPRRCESSFLFSFTTPAPTLALAVL